MHGGKWVSPHGDESTTHARSIGENCVNMPLMPMGAGSRFGLCTFAPSKTLIFGHFRSNPSGARPIGTTCSRHPWLLHLPQVGRRNQQPNDLPREGPARLEHCLATILLKRFLEASHHTDEAGGTLHFSSVQYSCQLNALRTTYCGMYLIASLSTGLPLFFIFDITYNHQISTPR